MSEHGPQHAIKIQKLPTKLLTQVTGINLRWEDHHNKDYVGLKDVSQIIEIVNECLREILAEIIEIQDPKAEDDTTLAYPPSVTGNMTKTMIMHLLRLQKFRVKDEDKFIRGVNN